MSETFKFGDEIYFTNEIAIQSSDIKIKTYLLADQFGNIMWDIPPKKYNLPIDFDNSLFVLCPKLSYVDKENKLSKESENIIQDVKDISNEENEDDQDDQDDEEDEAVEKVQYDIADKEAIKKRLLEQEHKEKLKELEERVIIENNRNQEILSNSKGSIVLYGSIVQIMHRSTGKFLCVKHRYHSSLLSSLLSLSSLSSLSSVALKMISLVWRWNYPMERVYATLLLLRNTRLGLKVE